MNTQKNGKTVEEIIKELNGEYDGVYQFRTLEETDYNKFYFDLLSQLTIAELPSQEEWAKRFNELKSANLTTIFVVECVSEKKVIATITCSRELKFIRNLGSICHIEDFVVDEGHRKKKVGAKLLNLAKEHAKQMGCYKMLLDSKDEVVSFYEKMGFQRTSNGMTIYF